MKHFLLAIPLSICAVSIAAPPPDFDQRVESLRNSLGVPGVSIAIVENGQVVLAKGYGIRKLERPEKVGPDTIFRTGSTGKAFTVAALATLVDQGKIKWDDKVIDHMPDFRMYDPWVTREMTIRDLLVHRSGLAQRNRETPPLHQAGDQFSKRLRLRQYSLHGSRPVDRGSDRSALGDLY